MSSKQLLFAMIVPEVRCMTSLCTCVWCEKREKVDKATFLLSEFVQRIQHKTPSCCKKKAGEGKEGRKKQLRV